MTRPSAEVTVIGHAHEHEHWALRDFLTRIAQPFNWIEAGACKLEFSEEKLPAVIIPDRANGEVIIQATVEKIAKAWGIIRDPEASSYDLAILGGGPAGLAAAVYAASDGLSTIVIDTDLPGGQAGHTSLIENFFGFPDGIGGAELTELALKQTGDFGAEVCALSPEVKVQRGPDVGIDAAFEIFVGDENTGWALDATQVIAATGMQWRRLEAVDHLVGKGVYYGAGRSEAAHCKGDIVGIVGAGNSAGQAAMTFADAGATVKLIVRGNGIDNSMSSYLVTRVANHPNIEVVLQAEVIGGEYHDPILKLTLRGTEKGGQEFDETVDRLFVCIGGEPHTEWASGLNLETEKGFLKTGPDLATTPQAYWDIGRPPTTLETSVPGLFAAGDVRWGAPRRVGGAVGDGAAAVALAHRVRQA